MIVFLYGKDSYRRLERKKYYEAQFEKKYGIPAETIDLAEEGGLARLEERSRSQSLFEKKKLLMLINIGEAEPKKILPILKHFLEHKDDGLLISEDKKPVKALDILLKKPAVTEEFEELKDAAWAKFVRDEAKKLGVNLDAAALNFLSDVYAGDSWGVVTELKKLVSASGEVAKADLEESGLEPEKNYFALVQSLKAPGTNQRLKALELLFAMQEPGAKIFNILAALWPQKTADFAKYDQAIKFGRMDFEEALLEIVLSGK